MDIWENFLLKLEALHQYFAFYGNASFWLKIILAFHCSMTLVSRCCSNIPSVCSVLNYIDRD